MSGSGGIVIETSGWKPMVVKFGSPWGKFMNLFAREARQILIAEVHRLLGTEEIYTLSPFYADTKLKDPRYRHIAGKEAEQPLILSGAMYNAIRVYRMGSELVLAIRPGATIDPDSGIDYGQLWEERTEFFEKAFENVADELMESLVACAERVIFDEDEALAFGGDD